MLGYLFCVLDNLSLMAWVTSIISGAFLLIGLTFRYFGLVEVDNKYIKTVSIVLVCSMFLTIIIPNSTSLLEIKMLNQKNLELEGQVLELKTELLKYKLKNK